MGIVLRIVLGVVSVLFLAAVISMITRNRLLLKYSFFWLIFGVCGIIAAAFPQIIYAFSGWLGFDTPANFVFFSILVILSAIALMVTRSISKQERTMRRVIQELSIQESEDQGFLDS